ncbi:MAG: thiamine phosphate synthase [Clostridiales bacterium]|nr:thiamine phosphate synthase [Clostridiales bacterium]MCF8021307.1 thiamine phosphate synthase [Clostridiales bacterium]
MPYRIIDANLNRLREGLRVVEDAGRFLLNDANIMSQAKEMRHQLSRIMEFIPGGNNTLITYRDSSCDIGKNTKLPTEMHRDDYSKVVTANLKRIEEAARVLEEYGKLVSADLGFEAKVLRFQSYSLEKKLQASTDKLGTKEKITHFNSGLYFITGEEFSLGRPVEEVVHQALLGGAKIIQLREKSFSVCQLISTGRKIRELTAKYNAVFIVNDRVDVAYAVDADGVHLGQDDLPVESAKKILGPGKLIGISTHSIEQAKSAQEQGADYIGVGPLFFTESKSDVMSPVGLELMREVSKTIKIPKVGIGGIKAYNAADAVDAGANSIAVITEIAGAENVETAARDLDNIIKLHSGE